MDKDQTLKKLETLRNTLEELRKSSLPLQIKKALYLALQNLDELEETLDDRQENTRLAALYRVSTVVGKPKGAS